MPTLNPVRSLLQRGLDYRSSAAPMISAVVVAPATKPKNGPKSRVEGKPGM